MRNNNECYVLARYDFTIVGVVTSAAAVTILGLISTVVFVWKYNFGNYIYIYIYIYIYYSGS